MFFTNRSILSCFLRPGDIIIDDDDDDDEEVIFIITTDLLSGHRRNKSKSTNNRDSGCSYDSEVSSGISL